MHSPSRATSVPASGTSGWRWLLVACGVYVLLRGLILYTAFDDTALWAYELYMCGTVARAQLGGGGDVPLPYYYDNAAGPVLMGLVVAPYFRLFGPSYLALKLMPMTLGLGVLVLAWLTLRRLFGARIAGLCALLVALAPTTLTKYTLIGAGNHSENLFFTLLATWVFFEMHARGVRATWLTATGLCAGAAFAIFIGALTSIGLLAIAHLGLRGWRRSALDALPALFGFALGLAPVVWLNSGSGGRGLAFLAAKFGEPSVVREPFATRVAAFFGEHLPAASVYPSFLGVPGRVADALFLAATCAAFAICTPRALRALADFARRQLGSPPVERDALQRAFVFCVWAYLPLTAVAYGLSNLKVGGYEPPIEVGGYRYFLPHLLYALVMIALVPSTTRPATNTWLRRGALALAGLPLALGAFNLVLIDGSFARVDVGAHYEGHNFAQVARTLLNPKLALPHERVVAHAESFAPLLRSRVYFGLGYYTALDLPRFRRAQPFEPGPLIARFPPERQVDVARGLGTALRHRQTLAQVPPAADRAQIEAWRAAGEPHVEHIVEGLNFDWLTVSSSRTAKFLADTAQLVAAAPPELRTALARGFGHACGRLLRREIEVDRGDILAALASVPAELRSTALDGLGAGLYDGVEQPRVDAFAVATFADGDIEAVLAGFERRAREVDAGELPRAEACIDARLPSAWRDAWSRRVAH